MQFPRPGLRIHSPSRRNQAKVGYILRLEGAKALLDAQVEVSKDSNTLC